MEQESDGMSVIVKGMEMPERCGACFLRVGGCKQRIYMEQRPKYCPLVEISTPHGQLIDADKLNMHDVSYAYGFCVMGVTAGDIELADTVIEAEGGE